MVAIKGHFDGKVIVPDEPLDFERGQKLIVHVEPEPAPAEAGPRAGSAKGLIWMADDFDAPLEEFDEYIK